MNKKTKAVVAGTAGAALLLGAGGTFALWSDHEQVRGGTITAGRLDVKAMEPRWYDVSQDRPDAQPLGLGIDWNTVDFGPESQWNGIPTDFAAWSGDAVGHEIDLDAWRTVPGDQIMGLFEVHAMTEGDNLEAELMVHVPSRSGELADALGLRYVVLEGNQPIGQAVPLDQPTHIHVPAGGGNMLQVLIVGDFSEQISGTDLMDAQAVLDAVQVDLRQVR
jgi:alternate signal-mediated exported protein